MFHYEIGLMAKRAKEMDKKSNQTLSSNFSYNFAKIEPLFYAITCICSNAFPDTYSFHNYNLSNDGSYIVDFLNDFIMSTEAFNTLIKT
ncbi:MAG: hypothetical protein HFJ02_06935 [Bacilli bacterium]|nr:hypothetical protein [Bacilli bacterium]